MHLAVLCPDNAGHLYPVGTLGRELADRGHRVTVLGGPKSAPIAEQLGLPLHEISSGEIKAPSAWLLWRVFGLFGAQPTIGMRVGFCRQAEALLQLMPAILKDLSVDGLLIDQIFAGGGTVAQHLGLPYVTIASALPWNEDPIAPPPFTHWQPASGMQAQLRNRMGYAAWHWFVRPTLKVVNRYRRTWQLRPLKHVDEEFSPLAQICQLSPEFDFRRRKLPAVFHYTGPLASQRPGRNGEFAWDRLDGRPLVFASLGTVPDPVNLRIFPMILKAFEGVNAQLVLALGKWTLEEGSVLDQLGGVPDDAIVVDFAPQLELLDRADLLITHAGQNTTLESLSRGVPIVAMPRNADQPGVAARVEHAGVGLRAFYRTVTTEQLHQKIQRVLNEDSFGERARMLQASLAAAGGVAHAADVVEQALTTQRPVPRASTGQTSRLAGAITAR